MKDADAAAYEAFLAKASYSTIFHNAWWLDIVTDKSWTVTFEKDGGETVACLPLFKKKSKGMILAEFPPLTAYLGPAIKTGTGKYSIQLSKQHRLLRSLLKKLPKTDLIQISCYPTFSNGLPFLWSGFQTYQSYTYQIAEIRNLKQVWDNFEGRTRTVIRKAQDLLSVKESADSEPLFSLVSQSYQRHGAQCPFTAKLLSDLVQATLQRNCGRLTYAHDQDGSIHAGVFTIMDQHTAYYVVGGSDTSKRNSGGNSLLIWDAIQHASRYVDTFDFEGSSVESIEEFFRSFGAHQMPVLTLIRQSRRFMIRSMMASLKHTIHRIFKKTLTLRPAQREI